MRVEGRKKSKGNVVDPIGRARRASLILSSMMRPIVGGQTSLSLSPAFFPHQQTFFSLTFNVVSTTPCRKLLCAECISETVRASEDLMNTQCPSCGDVHPITSTTFTPVSEVVLKVIAGLLLHCDQSTCTSVVSLQHLRAHVQSGCTNTIPAFSPSKITVGQILSRPLQSPPTSAEQKAAAKVVQRLLHTPESGAMSPVIKLTTDGTVSELA
jgi:hypothetical protein